MSPIVRGRFVAQIENSGRVKKSFDVLLWTETLSQKSLRVLDEIQQLREYLGTIHSSAVTINFWIPESFGTAHTFLNAYAITTSAISMAVPNETVREAFGEHAPARVCEAAATALSCDADMVITENSDWYPFYREFDKLNILIGSSEVLFRQSEIFVRGHDIPWAFSNPMFDAPWGPFYFFAENETLALGQRFLGACHKKAVDKEVQEVGRSLVYNRIPNILFTRDRLLFYEMQRTAAKRGNWIRQNFQFEAGYYLNFYYVLIFGGFDHLAVLLNGALGLGIPMRDVSARGQSFLKELEKKAPELHAIFKDAKTQDFMERIASLRHASAHRSQIMPAPVYEKPDAEPTVAELDEEIRAKGLDRDLQYFPGGPVREAIRENIRFKLRIEKYKIVLEDAVYLDTEKQKGFINPLVDTEWNFCKFYEFFYKVLDAAMKRI